MNIIVYLWHLLCACYTERDDNKIFIENVFNVYWQCLRKTVLFEAFQHTYSGSTESRVSEFLIYVTTRWNCNREPSVVYYFVVLNLSVVYIPEATK